MKVFLFSLACLLVVATVHSLDKARDCKCRIQSRKRIVGGRLADPASYPWQISMMRPDVIPVPDRFRKLLPDRIKMKKHKCGGSIINERWILTAGHCIPGMLDDNIQDHVIGFGDNDLVSMYDQKKLAKIEAGFAHPGYSSIQSGRNDIALIRLAEPLEFSESVQPACLATEFQEHYEGTLTTTGWGVIKLMRYDKKTNTTKDGIISRWLKETEIYDQTSTLDICQNIKEEQNICTNGDKYKNGRTSSCKGDSGGPLHYTKDGKTIVIGATSFGEFSDHGDTLWLCTGETSYTRVSKFIEWIKATAGDICE